MSFFHSVEFYIILAVIAAAIVAFSARPSARGPVEEYLVAGDLSDSPIDTPKIEVYCPDNGGIELWRYGVDGLTDTGALSLAITKKG
ncbi:MAG: hypothetical protein LIP03_05760 [Bacteroidales bacterium]|nr:hypothetical protein [Bacteroidales bacterium]